MATYASLAHYEQQTARGKLVDTWNLVVLHQDADFFEPLESVPAWCAEAQGPDPGQGKHLRLRWVQMYVNGGAKITSPYRHEFQLWFDDDSTPWSKAQAWVEAHGYKAIGQFTYPAGKQG